MSIRFETNHIDKVLELYVDDKLVKVLNQGEAFVLMKDMNQKLLDVGHIFSPEGFITINKLKDISSKSGYTINDIASFRFTAVHMVRLGYSYFFMDIHFNDGNNIRFDEDLERRFSFRNHTITSLDSDELRSFFEEDVLFELEARSNWNVYFNDTEIRKKDFFDVGIFDFEENHDT